VNSESSAPAPADEPLRVNIDDLDMDWDYQQATWQDQPFTGIAYEIHPNGMLVAESDYERGFKRASRQWYAPGQLRYERRFGSYGPEGVGREWYPNGQLKSETVSEHGIPLSSKSWDEHGNLTQSYELRESEPAFAELQERRRLHPRS
jgi:antitoxin component YwqK of YwqJK toxin-antitoxin module